MTGYQPRIEEEDGRWSDWIEELPGCAAWGYSEDEARAALVDALAAYLEDMKEVGEQYPPGGDSGAETPIVPAWRRATNRRPLPSL